MPSLSECQASPLSPQNDGPGHLSSFSRAHGHLQKAHGTAVSPSHWTKTGLGLTRAVQPSGISGPCWKKQHCLGPRMKYTAIRDHKKISVFKSIHDFVLGCMHSHPGPRADFRASIHSRVLVALPGREGWSLQQSSQEPVSAANIDHLSACASAVEAARSPEWEAELSFPSSTKTTENTV